MSRLTEILLFRDPPATPATSATQDPVAPQRVARVATVAGGTPETEISAPPPGTARCACCAHFEARPGDTPDGWCARHKVETWATPLFTCPTYRPADPALVALARRRAAVASDLKAHPETRYSFDVQGATPRGPAQSDVSVMLGVRTADGSIVAGELHVPAERWPGVGAFAAYWQQASEAPPAPVSA